MATIDGYKTDAITGINYTNIRSSEPKRQENQEMQEVFIDTHDNKISKFKAKGKLEDNVKKRKIPKKLKILIATLAIGVATIGATQVVGTNKLCRAMDKDARRNVYTVETSAGNILVREGSHERLDNQDIEKWTKELKEKGWNKNQIAIYFKTYYRVSINDTLNSTFLGRFSAREEAFKTNFSKDEIVQNSDVYNSDYNTGRRR